MPNSFFIPSKVMDLCEPIQHTWLKNRFLAQLEDNREAWINVEGELPSVLQAIPIKVQRMRELLADIDQELGPAHLVELLPISALPASVKTIITESVHRAFLELGITQHLIEGLSESVNRFEDAYHEAKRVWGDSPGARAQVIDDLKAAATRLRESFLALPSEVVLP